MRYTAIVLAALVFGYVWASNVGELIAAVTLSLPPDVGDWRFYLSLGVIAGMSIVFASVFAVKHWRDAWPFGGYFSIRGSRYWTSLFIGGILVAIVAAVLPWPEPTSPAASIGIIGGADGPTSIFIRSPLYEFPRLLPRALLVAMASVLAISVAYAMRKKAEPGATDNPGDAQRLREDH